MIRQPSFFARTMMQETIGTNLLLLQAVSDPRFAQVVGRHFQSHPVADSQANEMLAHFTRKMSQDLVLVIEPHAKHSSGQHGRYRAFYFDWLFVGQGLLTSLQTVQKLRSRFSFLGACDEEPR